MCVYAVVAVVRVWGRFLLYARARACLFKYLVDVRTHIGLMFCERVRVPADECAALGVYVCV